MKRKIMGLMIGLMFLTGCRYVDTDFYDRHDRERLVEEDTLEYDGVDGLSLKLPVGNILVLPSDDDKLRLDYKLRTKRKFSSQALKEIKTDLKQYSYGTDLDLEFSLKDSSGKRLDSLYWNVYLYLPEGLDRLKLDMDLGDMSLEHISGELDLKLGIGDIELDDIGFKGKSKIDLDLGDLDLSLANTLDGESIDINIGTGDGKIKLKSDDYVILDIKSYRSQSRREYKGEGRPTEINIKVGVGEIDVKR